MEELREETISHIRACLISTKGKCSLRQLEGDFRTIIGDKIPYKQLGFNRLEDFLATVQTLCLTKNHNGEVFVDAQSSNKSSHIANMVCKQKTKVRPKAVRFRSNSYIHPVETTRWRPKSSGFKNSNSYNAPKNNPRTHNQFVQYREPRVASKVVIPEHSGFSKKISQPPPTVNTTKPPRKPLAERLNLAHNHSDIQIIEEVKPVVKVTKQIEQQQSNHSVVNFIKSGKNEVLPPQIDSNTPLISAKKRITKKMSEMSLECDSGTSSPTSELVHSFSVPEMNYSPATASVQDMVYNPTSASVQNIVYTPVAANGYIASTDVPVVPTQPPVPFEEFKRTDDVLADLTKFVSKFNLGKPEFKFSEVKQKKKPSMHICAVKIGTHNYSSYPNDISNKSKAEKFTVNAALEDLIPKYNKPNKPSFLLSTSKDILDRIPPMLEKHQHGIWSWQLEADYSDVYQEQLPSNWLEIIDTSGCVSIEKVVDKYVLRHCKPGDKGQKWQITLDPTNVSVPSNTVQFGDDGRLIAEIISPISVNEIWCRQVDSREFDLWSKMHFEMERFYLQNGANLIAENITVDSFYVALADNTWVRLKVLEVEGEECNCFLIDYGDELIMEKSNLFQLKREFATIQAQAFLCHLVGLEELIQASINSESLQNLMGKQVVLEITTEDRDDDSNKLNLPVVLYDVNDGTSINEMLIQLLTIESASPIIEKGIPTEVYISNVESNGDIYVQLHSPGWVALEQLLIELEEQLLNNPPKIPITTPTKETSKDQLYFAKYKADERWYRIKIIDWSPKGDLAQIYFVDYGNTDVILVKNEILYPLSKFSDILTQYPFQAVKCKMQLGTDQIPSDFVELAVKLMPPELPVLLKIVSHDEFGVPLVEVFKRSQDEGLFCINKSITLETELRKGDGNNNMKQTKKKVDKMVNFADITNKNVPSGGFLPPPNFLTQIGGTSDIRVPFAVNPWNFFVQPLASYPELEELMTELQECYKDVQYSPLSIDDVIPGKIYASKYQDGCWYRTSVLKVIHAGSISVYYCDFGYYSNLTLQQLVPLNPEFMKLPYQAVKAKLAGIAPIQAKWTMEDCNYFKDFVLKKPFFAILMNIEKDELYQSDNIFSVILIDTTSPVDIYVNDKLVENRRAVKISLENN